MKPQTIIIALLLSVAASTASAQRAVILQLQNGQYVGIAYLPNGEAVILTSVQIIKLPDPTSPPSTVDRVTYVYEKDATAVPRPVSFALKKLNERGVSATEFDQDTVTGTGQVPTQYAIALKAAKDAGLPCLVVEGGGKVLRVLKNPTTEAEVNEAAK